MKKLYFLGLLIQSFAVFAQQDTTTIFSNPRGYFNDPLRANWDRKVVQEGNSWVLSLYDRKKVIREKISFEDKKLEIRKGPYAFYQDHSIIEEGEYDKGYKHGEWKYYNGLKQLIEKVNFSWDKLDGLNEVYWDNAQVALIGKYVGGKKNGLWSSYYRDGKLAGKEFYDEAGILKEKTYYDLNGVISADNPLFRPPAYPGGINAFDAAVVKLIKYPTKAIQKNSEGIVKLSFTVKKDGSIDDIKIVESSDDILSLEAIRILRLAGKWVPGKKLGVYVDEKYSLPIKFSLGNK